MSPNCIASVAAAAVGARWATASAEARLAPQISKLLFEGRDLGADIMTPASTARHCPRWCRRMMAGNEAPRRGDTKYRPRRAPLAATSAVPSRLADTLCRGADGTARGRRDGARESEAARLPSFATRQVAGHRMWPR